MLVKGLRFLTKKALMCAELTEDAETKKWVCKDITKNTFPEDWGITAIKLSEKKKASIKELQTKTMKKINHFRSAKVRPIPISPPCPMFVFFHIYTHTHTHTRMVRILGQGRV